MSIAFRPLEANLTHDTELIGRMDPYVLFIVGDQRIKSQVCRKGGKHPIWDDLVTVPFAGQAICLVEVRDKDILIDDRIGYCEIDLNEVQAQGRLKKWYPLMYKDKPAGELLMEATFNATSFGAGQGLAGATTPLATGMPLAGGLGAGGVGAGLLGAGLGHHHHHHAHGPAGDLNQSWTKGVNPVGGILPVGTHNVNPGVTGHIEQYAQEALLGGVDPLHSQNATLFNQQVAPNLGVGPTMGAAPLLGAAPLMGAAPIMGGAPLGTGFGQNLPLGSNIAEHLPTNLTQNIPSNPNLGGFHQSHVPGPIFNSGISQVLGTTSLGNAPLGTGVPGQTGLVGGIANQASRLAENVGIHAHNMGTPGTHVHTNQAPFGHGQMGNP